MKLVPPGAAGVVRIPPTGEPPPLVFSSSAAGRHDWTWRLAWRGSERHGSATTTGGRWNARDAIGTGGGDLDVTGRAGGGDAAATVTIRGHDPAATAIVAHLGARGGAAGFDRIVMHESRGRQFDDHGLPLVSFDGGVGLCQLTHPPATDAQTWDWRANLDAGLALFAAKRALAERHLGQGGRAFSDEQAVREAVCLWNGGHYHVWSGAAWMRPGNVVCDPAAGTSAGTRRCRRTAGGRSPSSTRATPRPLRTATAATGSIAACATPTTCSGPTTCLGDDPRHELGYGRSMTELSR